MCVTENIWCEYKSNQANQATDDAVNPEVIMSKTSVNTGCFNMVVYHGQHRQINDHSLLMMTDTMTAESGTEAHVNL